MNKRLKKTVLETFREKYPEQPIFIFSPGRINLIGEHTDYNDGFVFPAAINKGIGLAIAKTNGKMSKAYALDMKASFQFQVNKDIRPLENGGWKNYILGVVSEIQKMGCTFGNFNAVFAGNIPSGSGMSSSAALENAFVFGLNALFDLGLSRKEMIFISQKAEHHFAGVKCGIMDQYASMFGKKDSALLLDCRTIESTLYKIDFKDYKLMLINSNVKHDLSESAYNDRRNVCEMVSKKLQIEALRDATRNNLQNVRNSISKDDYDKALYVIEENQRVKAFSEAIKNNDLKVLGDLLYESHKGLSQKFKVSCAELDFLVEKTKGTDAVLGSRMMGGGFGGCTINIVKKSEYKQFKNMISDAFLKKFHRACSIYSVKLSEGTRIIEL